MEEIRTGRIGGSEISGSVSEEGRYAAIIRSIVDESHVGRLRLELRDVYISCAVFKLESSEAEWYDLLSHPE